MQDLWNINDECLGVFRVSIDDKDKEGLSGCENNQGVEFNDLGFV